MQEYRSLERASIYGRYSSDGQREESIDAQFRACREYCKQKGYLIVKEYKDEAFTGTNDQRPAFQEMMSDAKNKKFNIVVFHKIDRHSRNEYDYYYSKLQLKKYDVRIEYVAQHIDDSPEGAMMEAMLVGMSAYYSRNLSKEVLKGKRENAYKGLFNGGTPPLGYKITEKKYVIDEYEAQAVRLIFDMYLHGHGYVAITDELNRQGYKTKAGRAFGKNSLHEILRNVRYTGTYILGKTRPNAAGKRNTHGDPSADMIFLEDMIPAIISKEDFGKVITKMEMNKRRSAAYKAKYTYLLSGLVYCGECGALMQGKTTTRHNPDRIYQYYYCGAQNRKGTNICNNDLVNLVDLEDLVIQKLESVLFAPAAKSALIKKFTTAYEKRACNINTEREILLKQKNKTSRKMDMLYTQIEEGLADEYDLARLKKVKEEMNTIKLKLSEIEDRPKANLTIKQIESVLDSYHTAIKTKSTENLRALIGNFINKITVSKDEIVISYKINLFLYDGAVDGT